MVDLIGGVLDTSDVLLARNARRRFRSPMPKAPEQGGVPLRSAVGRGSRRSGEPGSMPVTSKWTLLGRTCSSRAADAHRELQQGHVRGKLVLTP